MCHVIRGTLGLGFVLTLAAAACASEGIVVDPAGTPVAGADVFAYTSTSEPETPRRARSGADGKFTFEPPRHRSSYAPTQYMLAHKPGFAVGAQNTRSARDRAATMRIVLQPSKPVSVRVLDPDGKPLRDVRVSLHYLSTPLPYAPIHESLRARFSQSTDAQGNVSMEFVPAKTQFYITVDSPAFGKQVFGFSPEQKDRTCQLKPVGSLEGQIVAPEAKAASNLLVEIASGFGRARVRTDEQGRFTIARLAAGQTQLTVHCNEQLPYRVAAATPTQIDAGKTANVRIELVKGIEVTGRVIDDKTSKPIAGATLNLAGKTVVTDKDGRYKRIVPPGNVFVYLNHVSGLYVLPVRQSHGTTLKPGSPPHELEPFRLTKGIAISGRVVDERDRPVAEARVWAHWRKTDGRLFTIGSQLAESDEDGRFVVQPVGGDAELALTAETDDRASESTLRLSPGSKKPVTLRVASKGAATLVGRVLDPDGEPVAGARIEFLRARRIPTGRIYGNATVYFAGREELTTGPDGIFRTPIKLPRREQYALRVVAAGMVQRQTGYLKLDGAADPVRLNDLVLQRESSLAGQVVDSQGRPVAGATVWSHGNLPNNPWFSTSNKTDQDGRFHLKPLHPQARFAFVEKDGYRFTGAVIPKAGEVRIALESADAAPSGKPLRSHRRPRDQRQKLLRGLLLPIYPRLLEERSDHFRLEVVKRLAPYDPGFALEQLEKLRLDRSRVTVLLAMGGIDDALEIAATLKDPNEIAWRFFAAADVAEKTARKKEIVLETLVYARRVQKPDQRVLVLGEIAERLYDLYDRKAARKILDEGHPLAAKLATTDRSGFARARFAEALALFEPDEARKLVIGLKDRDAFTRHVGNIAHELAGVNPAEAERFINMIEQDSYVTPYAVRICYRMARADVPRARRIADALGQHRQRSRGIVHRAQAYGIMAMAVAEKKPGTARELLRAAFEQLRSLRSPYDGFEVSVALVRYSEMIDPTRTREYFWRAVALHAGFGAQGFDPIGRQQEVHQRTANLVILLGLYDQLSGLRRELMEPIFVHWEKHKNRNPREFYRQNAVFTAMALTDPQRAIRWVHGFLPKLSKEDRRLIPQPWTTIADALHHTGPDLGRKVCEEVFGLWVIDEEDR